MLEQQAVADEERRQKRGSSRIKFGESRPVANNAAIAALEEKERPLVPSSAKKFQAELDFYFHDKTPDEILSYIDYVVKKQTYDVLMKVQRNELDIAGPYFYFYLVKMAGYGIFNGEATSHYLVCGEVANSPAYHDFVRFFCFVSRAIELVKNQASESWDNKRHELREDVRKLVELFELKFVDNNIEEFDRRTHEPTEEGDVIGRYYPWFTSLFYDDNGVEKTNPLEHKNERSLVDSDRKSAIRRSSLIVAARRNEASCADVRFFGSHRFKEELEQRAASLALK